MKRSIWIRIIAIVLVFSLLPVNVSAAGFGTKSSGSRWAWNWDWLWDLLPGIIGTQPGEETEPVETEPVETEPEQPATGSDGALILVEDETTVENGEMLRASTYLLSNPNSAPVNNAGIALMSANVVKPTADETEEQAEGTTLKYFGVTMYNYDQNVINNATHMAEVNGTLGDEWEGLYFSGGTPTAVGFIVADLYNPAVDADGNVIIEDGTYYIRCDAYYLTNRTSSSNDWRTTAIQGTTESEDIQEFTITAQDDGSYTIQNSSNRYLTISGNNTASYSYNSNTVNIVLNSKGNLVIQDGSYYLNCLGGQAWFGGWTTGSTIYLYEASDDLTEISSMAFAAWNHWNKKTSDNANGQKTYTGLVASQLDANKDIVFNVPDGGIFNADSSVKDIYTNVQMPFVYANGVYTFDASQYGVYFADDPVQGSSSTPASGARLYFNENSPQSNGTKYADTPDDEDGTVWMPFNNVASIGSEGNCDYHFGMRTTIPFTMTSNGRMNQNDDSSDAITFSFSGDDDVWVFIDGKLIIDLGGIHNRLDATINFAENTVVYSESNKLTTATGSYNDEGFELTQTLFGNLIPQDRETFAAADTHELTIFYLERGKGSSNCKISFNLPMKDTVTVTKHATQSWTAPADGDGEGEVTNLTEKEQEIVNNIDFGFTLYKSTDGGTTFATVANTNFNLVNENGQVLEVRSTDANGHFTLRNGQSARFVTAFTNVDNQGVTYYVVEDDVSKLGFVTPDFNFDGAAADGFAANGTEYDAGNLIPEQIIDVDATENKSYAVTVYGSDESEDSVVFICENYIDAKLPNPSALPADDRIVIDYGLGVNINILGNDNFRGDTIEIVGVYGSDVKLSDEAKGTLSTELSTNEIVNNPDSVPAFGTVTVNDDNTLTYQLNKQLTAVEELKYVIKVTGKTTNSAGTENTAYAYGIATVYIIPATTMYYEEDFANMITYTGSNWQTDPVVESSYTNATQEPGVVGTVGDSPYGSDAAYINDSHDSNGTSRYANTSASAVKFSYSFTGTGTSFFTRTSNTTGFMRVDVTDANSKMVSSSFRDTRYQNDGTLYNIPVYTINELPYGTYTVTVLVYRGTDFNRYGTDFYLDGVRVYQPLDPQDLPAVAASAYATDGEANMANVTLRNKLICEADIDEEGNTVWTEGGNFVLFTDIDGAMDTAEEYISYGPKEEVYLNNGQSVTFSLTNWDPNSNRIYLGIKAPTGSGTVTIGSTTLTITNAADCYYDISSYGTITTDAEGIKTITFTITANAGSLISLTTIKVSGNFEFTIINSPEIEVDNGEEQNLEEEDVIDDEDNGNTEDAEEPTEDVTSEEPVGDSADQNQEV